jgi:2-methylisocitrate lyase-like PEP mutase family enzyme
MTHLNVRKYRSLLDASGFIELIGCYDALSAMILEEIGFEAIFLSGFSVAASFLGNPDIGLTTLTETSAIAKNIVKNIKIPLIADIDDGYGDVDNVARTIYEMECAGVAGVILEDDISPKSSDPHAGKKILSCEQYLKKLERALTARKNDTCIIARTDESDIDKAIQRCKLFHKAGADITFIGCLSKLDDIKKVGEEVPGHKQLNLIYGGKTPLLPATDYYNLGFKSILYALPTLLITSLSLFKQLKKLHQSHDLSSISSDSMELADFQALIQKRFQQRP